VQLQNPDVAALPENKKEERLGQTGRSSRDRARRLSPSEREKRGVMGVKFEIAIRMSMSIFGKLLGKKTRGKEAMISSAESGGVNGKGERFSRRELGCRKPQF